MRLCLAPLWTCITPSRIIILHFEGFLHFAGHTRLGNKTLQLGRGLKGWRPLKHLVYCNGAVIPQRFHPAKLTKISPIDGSFSYPLIVASGQWNAVCVLFVFTEKTLLCCLISHFIACTWHAYYYACLSNVHTVI